MLQQNFKDKRYMKWCAVSESKHPSTTRPSLILMDGHIFLCIGKKDGVLSPPLSMS